MHSGHQSQRIQSARVLRVLLQRRVGYAFGLCGTRLEAAAHVGVRLQLRPSGKAVVIGEQLNIQHPQAIELRKQVRGRV
jgi:hypothetical protein